MADNVTLDPGAGGVDVAADDVSSVYYQKIKLDAGGDGVSVPVIAGRQADAASIPVALSSEDVALLDGIEGLLAGTLTVGSHAVTNAGTFAVQVSSIAAGTNAIGKLAANSGVDIGDVDVTSVPADPFGVNADAASATGSISAKLRFIAATGIPITSLPTLAAVTTVSTVSALTGGGVAHDGADSGNPVKIGGRARSTEIAAVASDDRADFVTDLVGKQIVLPYANPENFVSGCISSAMTGTTSASLIAAPASGLRNYITQITVSNAHATVGTDIIIQDGSGGTTLYVIPAAAVYGGAVITFPTPLRQPTTATALYCANVTTGASTKVSASGYKGA